MKFEEVSLINQRTNLIQAIAFLARISVNVKFRNDVLRNVTTFGVTENQALVQPIKIETGRYISTAEFVNGSPVVIIGYNNAQALFGDVNFAFGKQIIINGKHLTILGVFKKEGTGTVWDYDNCLLIPYNYFKTIENSKLENATIIVKAKEGINSTTLISELKSVMRQVRRLSPIQENNFSLNDVQAISKMIASSFASIDVIGS